MQDGLLVGRKADDAVIGIDVGDIDRRDDVVGHVFVTQILYTARGFDHTEVAIHALDGKALLHQYGTCGSKGAILIRIDLVAVTCGCAFVGKSLIVGVGGGTASEQCGRQHEGCGQFGGVMNGHE